MHELILLNYVQLRTILKNCTQVEEWILEKVSNLLYTIVIFSNL